MASRPSTWTVKQRFLANTEGGLDTWQNYLIELKDPQLLRKEHPTSAVQCALTTGLVECPQAYFMYGEGWGRIA